MPGRTIVLLKKKLQRQAEGGTRPPTPDDITIEVKDLLNPAELLKDHNIFDSDGYVSKSLKYVI